MTDEVIHQVVISFLFPTLVVFAGVVAYLYFIRPILKQSPAFKELYATEDTMLSAISAKLSGLKQKLTTVFISFVGLVLVGHDSIAALLPLAGIDPVAYGAQLLPKVPAMAWPVITLGCLWLIQYFRNLADKQARANAEALLMSGQPLAASAPGLSINTLPSPQPFPDKVG